MCYTHPHNQHLYAAPLKDHSGEVIRGKNPFICGVWILEKQELFTCTVLTDSFCNQDALRLLRGKARFYL